MPNTRQRSLCEFLLGVQQQRQIGTGKYSGQSLGVDGAVDRYLLELAVPAPGTRCA